MIKSCILLAIGIGYVWLLAFLSTVLDFNHNYWWTGPYVLTAFVVGFALLLAIVTSITE